MTDAAREILPSLIALVGELFMTDTAGLGPHSTAADVAGWDSVSQVMLVMRIEDEYAIVLEGEAVSMAGDLGRLAELIAARRGEG